MARTRFRCTLFVTPVDAVLLCACRSCRSPYAMPLQIPQAEVTSATSPTCGAPLSSQQAGSCRTDHAAPDVAGPQVDAADAVHHRTRNNSGSLQPGVAAAATTITTDDVSGTHQIATNAHHHLSSASARSSAQARRNSMRTAVAIDPSRASSSVPVTLMQLPVPDASSGSGSGGPAADADNQQRQLSAGHHVQCTVTPSCSSAAGAAPAHAASTVAGMTTSTSSSSNGTAVSPSMLASPHKRALWRRATREGYAMRRAVLKRMCAIEQAPSPREDQPPPTTPGQTLQQTNATQQKQQQQQQQVAQHLQQQQQIAQHLQQQQQQLVTIGSEQGLATAVVSSGETYVGGSFGETGVIQPAIDAAAQFEAGQIIMADPDNVEVMVASAMKQIKLAVTDYLVSGFQFIAVFVFLCRTLY